MSLITSEERFKAFTNQTTEGITVADLDGNYVFVNPAFCKMSGYTNEELLQKTVFDMKAENQSHESFRESKEKKIGIPIQVNLQRKDKTEYLTEIIGNIITVDGEELVLGTIRDITERKKIENNLKKEQERAQTYLETANVMFVAIDNDGIVTLVNQKTCEVLECTEDEIVGKNWFDNFLPKQEITVIKTYSDKLLKNKTLPTDYMENTVITKSGAVRMVAWHNTILQDYKGNTIGHLSSGEDITKRKKFEILLQKYYDIINRSPAVAFLWRNEENWPVELVSENIKELCGYTVDDFMSGEVSYSKLIHPEDLDRVLEEVIQNSADSKINDFTHLPYRIITKDNEVKWIDDLTSIVRDAAGTITHYQGIVQDITLRKETEETNALLTRAIEQADETIVITDSLGTIQYVNPAFEKASGYSKDDAIGENPRVLKSGQQSDNFYKKMWATLSNGKQWQGEIINKKKDGSFYTENVTISPVFDSHGEIITMLLLKMILQKRNVCKN